MCARPPPYIQQPPNKSRTRCRNTHRRASSGKLVDRSEKSHGRVKDKIEAIPQKAEKQERGNRKIINGTLISKNRSFRKSEREKNERKYQKNSQDRTLICGPEEPLGRRN